jgi:hypothetical protein
LSLVFFDKRFGDARGMEARQYGGSTGSVKSSARARERRGFVGFALVAALAAGCGSSGGSGGPATAAPLDGGSDAPDSSGHDTTSGDDVGTDAGDSGQDDDLPECCTACQEGFGATLRLACAPTEPPTAVVTGPCAVDASTFAAADPGWSCSSTACYLNASTAGDCHLTLTFAGGFTYTTDVEFKEMPQACCGCPLPYVVASPSEATIDNPISTCASVDAGGD